MTSNTKHLGGKRKTARAPASANDIDPVELLSFVKNGQGRRCFWNVTPSGDYAADNLIGNKLALEYLAFEEANPEGPGCLQRIVSDMPRDLTGIEVAFLSMVAWAAGAGANRARQISAYWDSCRKEGERT